MHYCETTKLFTTREYRDVTSLAGLPTSAQYPTKVVRGMGHFNVADRLVRLGTACDPIMGGGVFIQPSDIFVCNEIMYT